jgi:two-component system, OmpR family, response regulator
MTSTQRRGAAGFVRADGSAPQVLVVDDERDLTHALVAAFTYDGWQARGRMDGQSAVAAARDLAPDLVILDIQLPDIDGFEVLHRLRSLSEQVCVLFLTARDAVHDRVSGLTAGADDYVTKPFSIEEVLARSRALLRRAGVASTRAGNRLRVGDLTLDEDAREVTRAGATIELTGTEFELLRFLMRNPRHVMSKEQILDQVWQYDFGGSSHVVELYISYLRKKVDFGPAPMIHTVRGFGYVLRPAAP